MKSPQNFRMKGAALLLLLLSFGLNSCKKSKSNETGSNDGPAKVIIQMQGVDENSEQLVAPNGVSSGKPAVNSVGIQHVIVPFNKDYNIEATLIPVGPSGSETKGGLSTNAINPKLQTNAIVQTSLGLGVWYAVLAYDSDGNLVDYKDYKRGNEASAGDMQLDGGKTYTFIACSMNDTSSVVPIQPGTESKLSTVMLPVFNGLNLPAMYFKKVMKVAAGDNYLDIILKHQLSQITTNITLTGVVASITAISGVTISPTRSGLRDMLGDGTLIYNAPSNDVANVLFPAITAPGGMRSITSTPTVLMTPAVTNGVLTIGSLTISNNTKTNITIPGLLLTITPGVKYNLNLTINAACGGLVALGNGSLDFTMSQALSPPASNSQTVTYHDKGNGPFNKITYFIYSVANSFNMTINGVPLISKAGSTDHEIQFDNYPGFSLPVNIGFSGGGTYGDGTNPHIYDLVPNAKEMIQIQIDLTKTGANVAIFGKKTSGATTLPTLTLLNGYTFNHIDWNLTGDNTVTISQQVNGLTFFRGAGDGGKATPCNP